MIERAQTFDLRTEEMRKEWYLTFSGFRQGSFLPRNDANKEGDKEWNIRHKQAKRKDGEFGSLPPYKDTIFALDRI